MGFEEVSCEIVSSPTSCFEYILYALLCSVPPLVHLHLHRTGRSLQNTEMCSPLMCPLNIQIFLINLKRRLDRRIRMLKTFAALGLQATLTDAVDGK